MALFKTIETTISNLDTSTIEESRKETLLPLIHFIQEKVTKDQTVRLNFICTHNSRRSHLSQVWAQVMAYHFNIKNVFSYSGGTEATALFPVVAETLKGLGFKIETLSKDSNPIYSISYTDNEHPMIGFSKTFDDAFNPKANFAAVMTCTEADKDCPFIAGAEQRIPLPFKDPKAFDNTPRQAEKYLERSLQIATELFYVFSKITSKNGSK